MIKPIFCCLTSIFPLNGAFASTAEILRCTGWVTCVAQAACEDSTMKIELFVLDDERVFLLSSAKPIEVDVVNDRIVSWEEETTNHVLVLSEAQTGILTSIGKEVENGAAEKWNRDPQSGVLTPKPELRSFPLISVTMLECD